MEQTNKERNKLSYMESFKLLIRLLRFCGKMAPKEIPAVLVINIVSGLTTLAVLFSLQHLIDAVSDSVNAASGQNGSNQVIIWLLVFIATLLITRLLNLYGNVITNHVQEIVKEKCQREIMEKACRLSLEDFDQSSLYDRLKRVDEGMDQRFFSTMSFIFRLVTLVISVASVLFYLVFIHWLIPIVLTVGSFVFTVIHVKVLKEKYMLHRKQTTPARMLLYIANLMTSRNAGSELRLYGLKHYLLKEWNRLNDEMLDDRLKLARREYRLQLTSSVGHTLTFALVLIGIILLITRGVLSLGQYASFIRAVLSFQTELNQLMWTAAMVHNDLKYIDDFFLYLDLPEENREGEKLPAYEGRGRRITFREIGFAYPGSNEMVLKDLDMEIQPGEKIALIGDNGSGKSTLIKLLLGLYKPVKGSILIDGTHLSKLNLNQWRAKATAIFQDFHQYKLLNVRENIAVGQIAYRNDLERVQEAALLSGADAFIQALPEAYEAMLGKEFGGQELSQGQWQKIAIARAYIRDSDLLILDEPTAALDAKSEVEIYRQFEQVAKGKTVIFISHRLGVAKLADRIIVLKDGRVEEQGSHDELMKGNGYYAHQYRLQAQWYQ